MCLFDVFVYDGMMLFECEFVFVLFGLVVVYDFVDDVMLYVVFEVVDVVLCVLYNLYFVYWCMYLNGFVVCSYCVLLLWLCGCFMCVVGFVFEVIGLCLLVGVECMIELLFGSMLLYVEVEVVGFVGDCLFLMLIIDVVGVLFGVCVWLCESVFVVDLFVGVKWLLVGWEMFGCVVDVLGCLFDGFGLFVLKVDVLLLVLLINLFDCELIYYVFDVGVCVINVLFIVGCG